MSHLKDFNWTGFWKDTDYAFESYIGRTWLPMRILRMLKLN